MKCYISPVHANICEVDPHELLFEVEAQRKKWAEQNVWVAIPWCHVGRAGVFGMNKDFAEYFSGKLVDWTEGVLLAQFFIGLLRACSKNVSMIFDDEAVRCVVRIPCGI